MFDTSTEINSTHLCVLELDKECNKLFVKQNPILNLVSIDMEELKTMFYSLNNEERYRYIESHPNMKVIIPYIDYCVELDGCNQGLSRLESLGDANLESIIKIISQRIEAYNLCETYKRNSTSNTNKRILAQSHRKLGWNGIGRMLENKFRFQVSLNFGYGSVSYFYTKIEFKGFSITPYTDYIKYRFADFVEIKNYSSKHCLCDKSWNDAFQYIVDAQNLALENEELFVLKYIVNECENFVEGLENYLSNNTFTFHKLNGDKYEITFNELEIIDFRGEKISGSIDFIAKIDQYNFIKEIQDVITRVKLCNIQASDQLTKGLLQVENEKTLLEEKYQKYCSLKVQVKAFTTLRDEIRANIKHCQRDFNDNTKMYFEDINNIFDSTYIEYPKLKEQLCTFSEYEYASQRQNLAKYKSRMTYYKNKIDKFLEKVQ